MKTRRTGSDDALISQNGSSPMALPCMFAGKARFAL
jgi:hypothetical protein